MLIPKVLLLIQAGIFGLLVGSFLNVCIYRLPQNMSILGRSFCRSCNTVIPLYRNIPLLTFLFQRGKSACCNERISIQYPLVEALTGFMAIITLLHSQSLAEFFIWFCLFICPLLIVSIIDLKLKIIPDSISLPFILVGIAVIQFYYFPNWLEGLKFSGLGILVGGGSLLILAEVVSRLKKVDAMGGGDIKLSAMLGAFLGWKAMIFVFFVSSVLALVYAVITMIVRKNQDRQIPFGPFLSMAAMIFWLYGPIVTQWYFVELMGYPENPFF